MTPVHGVYLCDHLDLPEIFGAALAQIPGIAMFTPDAVPDPSAIRFALAWRPGAEAFTPYPNLTLVQVIAAGVDPVLKVPSLPPSAIVTRVHDPEQAAVMAGFAAWHVIWHHRKMGTYLAAAAEARWERALDTALRAPSQVTVGLLGLGHMGRAIGTAIAAMGFPVLAATRQGGLAPPGITRVTGPNAVPEVAGRADILINVLPLTPDTADILNAALFAQMPQGATLIQLGRGDHLIEQDLLDALDSGHLSGASLDVFRQEPLPPTHPFWRHPNIFVTPHEASITAPGTVAETLARSLHEIEQGQTPTAAIDRNSGY